MKTKHTPGEWHYEATNDGESALSSDGVIIATCPRYTGYVEEAIANARLIAAAPELLEALQGLLNCFWEKRPKRDVKRDYHLMVQCEAARSAIAKATNQKGNEE